MKRIILGLCLISIIYSCNETKEQENNTAEEKETLFSLLDSTKTGINFENNVINKKNINIFKYRNFYNGGGVAIGDINNDGLPDIYFTSNQNNNKLYLNKGDFKFEDISKKSGVVGAKAWSTGVVMVDINADNLLDIYVCNAGDMNGANQKNELFINNGDLTFTEKAEEYNLDESGFTTHAAFFDYDKDGDLDAYILNNSFIPVNSLQYNNKRDIRAKDWNLPKQFLGGGDKLLRNDNGKFKDVSEESGIYGSLIGFGLGVTIGDVNNDFYPDIYISNDFYEHDYLYINNHDGTFKEDIENWTGHISHSSMGADMADINNDGAPDIFVTDMLVEDDQRAKRVTSFDTPDIYNLKQHRGFYNQYMQNTLQLNNGHNSMSEIAYFSNVAKTDWSWGPLIFDMDNDGYRDIFVSNGINHDLTDGDFMNFFANELIQKMVLTGEKKEMDSIINKMPSVPVLNYAFKNNQDLTFSNKTKKWGFNAPSFSNGSAYGDLDNDGDLDLVINNVNMPSFVYRNNSESLNPNHHYIKLKLKGINKNTFGIGGITEIYTTAGLIRNELVPSRGFQSSIDYTLTTGLGNISNIDSINIYWPSGKMQKLIEIPTDTTIVVHEKDALKTATHNNTISTKTSLLSPVTNVNLIKHTEDVFSDYDYEGLISKKVSQEGPAIAVGDVNNDGNEDIFIGGAKNQTGTFYFNKGNGKLNKSPQEVFEDDQKYEDTYATFFDVDGDKDIDLVVGSGGNEEANATNYKVRIYLNDGKGNFSKSEQNIPSTFHNISVIAPYDFDNDGDMDVFVGSRSVPGIYGIDPKHLFLENQGNGTFKDITKSIAYDLKDIGMVTDAKWIDIDSDNIKDLVIVGDWMTPKVLFNSGKRLLLKKTALDNYSGWWNAIESADIDNDGDTDLILGNQGSNIAYKASTDAPMRMFINDYDNNGTIEQIVTRSIHGKDMPIHMKKELTQQLSSLKKQNLKASEYSKKSIQELFSKEIFNNSIVKEVNTMESLVAINKGNGAYEIKILPSQVQFSCVCDIYCNDINNDGNLDLVMAGNNYEFKPQFSRLDANYGSVLLGDGKGNFEWQNYDKSGMFVKGEVKKIQNFKDASGTTYLLLGINDQQPKIFKVNE